VTTELDYTVLPVSALKKQHAVVFDTLKAGKTVYVANHGRVVAAFRPASFVPEAIAASATSPYVEPPTVNARVLHRGNVSQAIADASVGLVSIVEKDRSVYGILTPATTPEPTQIPDMATIGKKAEIMRKWREDNPKATIEEVMAHSQSLDAASVAEDELQSEWKTTAAAAITKLDNEAAIKELQHWKDSGSRVEDAVTRVIVEFAKGKKATPIRIVAGRSRARGAAEKVASTPSPYRVRSREAILHGEKDQAAGYVLRAREKFFDVLIGNEQAKVGAAFALGNLARIAGNRNEAAVWYTMALQVTKD